METLIEYFLHVDRYLAQFAAAYGAWIYGLLFTVVFAETGLIVAPFLPGDSLLFAAGAIAAIGGLDVVLLIVLLSAAAILGDSVNYSLGRRFGPAIVDKASHVSLWGLRLDRRHLDHAHAFFERHGGKAIVLARFAPFIRTFVPFVAGAAGMNRATFLFYNVTGGLAWVTLCVGAGFLFGNVPIVRENFSMVVLAIIIISLIPALAQVMRRDPGLSRSS